ncbi:MAG: Mx8p50 [Caulobacteraceae bacterium]|nr:Mx8p50 [Caulobacteraceae bacterium]
MDLDFTPTRPGDRDVCIPEFYQKPVRNAFRSQQEGREVYEDRDYVRIIVPGPPSGSVSPTVVDRAVTAEHKERWPRQFAAFQAGAAAPLEGTPIEEWAAIGRAQAMELAACQVRTVEALAALPDLTLQKVAPMGGLALRDKARAFLDQAAGLAPLSAAMREIEDLKARLKLADEAVAALGARLEAATRIQGEAA